MSDYPLIIARAAARSAHRKDDGSAFGLLPTTGPGCSAVSLKTAQLPIRVWQGSERF